MTINSFETAPAWSEADSELTLGRRAQELPCKGSRGAIQNSSCFGGKHLLFTGAW